MMQGLHETGVDPRESYGIAAQSTSDWWRATCGAAAQVTKLLPRPRDARAIG